MSEIDPVQIRQIEQRLQDVWRKHVRVIISDSQEVSEVKERLESILVTLSSFSKSGAEPSDVRLVARDLSTAQRQLAILGFVNVARVIERVAENLADLETGNGPAEQSKAPQRFEPPPTSDLDSLKETGPLGAEEAQRPRASFIWLAVHGVYGGIIGWGVLRVMTGALTVESISSAIPLTAGIVLGLLIGMLYRFTPTTTHQAIVRLLVLVIWLLTGCASLTYLILHPAVPVVEIAEAVEPTATPRIAPPPTATPILRLVDEDPIEDISARVEVEIKRTKAFMAKSDIDKAIESFGTAVTIDRHHPLINDTAEKLIKAMLDEADRATDVGRWDRASELVNDALRLATHFHLDTGAIKHTRSRHDSTARFVDLLPHDLNALNSAIGKRVKLTLKPSDTIRGTISKVSPNDLTLDANSGVGGGQVRFTRSYPLNEIQNIRVYGEGMIDPPKVTPTPTVAPRPQRRHRTLPQRRRRTPVPRRR